jgi:hypothetical protein
MLALLRGYKRSNLPLLVLRRLFSAAIVFGLNQQTFSIQRLILENKKNKKIQNQAVKCISPVLLLLPFPLVFSCSVILACKGALMNLDTMTTCQMYPRCHRF